METNTKLRQPSSDRNPNDLDDLLRLMLADALRREGLSPSSIHDLFEAIESPTTPTKPWSWLRSQEARTEVACLVLIFDALGDTGGAVFLTTFRRAKQFLGLSNTKVIDVSSFMAEIERRTGRNFDEKNPPAGPKWRM